MVNKHGQPFPVGFKALKDLLLGTVQRVFFLLRLAAGFLVVLGLA